jgi:non-heme chloroperoxidase
MTYEAKPLRLPTGVTLSYVEQGDPSGTPVLLLHGYTDSWHSFEHVLPHLPRSIRAFAPSQRGHGDSDRPATGYRTRDFAADAAAFVHAVGATPAIVVGHSMGGTHALRFAIDYPEITKAIVIVSSWATYRDSAVINEFWESSISRLTDPIDPGFAREFQESTTARPIEPEFLETAVRESLKVPARVWRAAFEGFLASDFTADLHRIRVPALVFWGDRDSLCSRADEDALVAALAGSRLVVYEGVGHALHWEAPERFSTDLVAFIDGLARTSSETG